VLLPLGVTVKVYAVVRAKPVTVQLCEPVGAVVTLETMQVKAVAVGPAVNAATV
jgi:hypothetical protein